MTQYYAKTIIKWNVLGRMLQRYKFSADRISTKTSDNK